MSTGHLVLAATVLALLLLFVAVPAIVAVVRRHPDAPTIAKLTPLALFSFALWIALIIWAASDKRDDAVISKYIARLRQGNLLPWVIGGLVVVGLASGAVMSRGY